ncbi:unnamed protein product [Arctogadus glacialis]
MCKKTSLRRQSQLRAIDEGHHYGIGYNYYIVEAQPQRTGLKKLLPVGEEFDNAHFFKNNSTKMKDLFKNCSGSGLGRPLQSGASPPPPAENPPVLSEDFVSRGVCGGPVKGTANLKRVRA